MPPHWKFRSQRMSFRASSFLLREEYAPVVAVMFVYVVKAPVTVSRTSTVNFLPERGTLPVVRANTVNASSATYASGTPSYTDKRSENATPSMETSSWGSTRVGTSMSVTNILHVSLIFLLTALLKPVSFMSLRIWLLPGTGSLWKFVKYPAMLSRASGGMPSVGGKLSAALQFLYLTLILLAISDCSHSQHQELE